MDTVTIVWLSGMIIAFIIVMTCMIMTAINMIKDDNNQTTKIQYNSNNAIKGDNKKDE